MSFFIAMTRKFRCAIAVCSYLWLLQCFPTCAATSDDKQSRYPVLLANTLATAAIGVWGVQHWDYGENEAHAEREHWFSLRTKNGGADKLGHSYTAYALTSAFYELYVSWDIERERAENQAAWSSFLVTGLMELGDAFSPYGFSYEDVVMNAAGTLLGRWIASNSERRHRYAFRVEYEQFNSADIFTNYEDMKFLAVVKGPGLGLHGIWRYVELSLGYYARGFVDANNTERQRTVFAGVGLNLPFALRSAPSPVATLLDFVQVPNTYLATEHVSTANAP